MRGIENLGDVQLFVQVVDSGGLTAAGRVLRLPTNQISRRLVRLEEALGARLLHRTTRRVAPTDEGKAFYGRALRLLEAAREAEDAVARRGGLEGTVRVAVRTTSVEFGFVSEVVGVLRRQAGLGVQLLVSDDELDLVAEGVDLSVQVGALADSTNVARRVGEANYVLAAAPAYLQRHGRPDHPEDLVHHQAIRRLGARPELAWTLRGPGGREVTVPIGGRFECSDSRAQAVALQEGLGIALRPAGEVRAAQAAGTLQRVLPAWRVPPIPVWAVSPAGRVRLARVAAFVEALRLTVRRFS